MPNGAERCVLALWQHLILAVEPVGYRPGRLVDKDRECPVHRLDKSARLGAEHRKRIELVVNQQHGRDTLFRAVLILLFRCLDAPTYMIADGARMALDVWIFR